MSDILIKGMEMPTEREGFNLTIKYNGLVFDTGTGIQVAEAHELPPHGRLIDADALKAEGWELQRFRHDEYGCSITCRSLDSEDIPTIIPATEVEEES